MSEARTAPRVAYYGDDFTGSVDVLLQFARHGWSGRLFTADPDDDLLAQAVADGVEVIGIAGISRSLDSAALTAEVSPRLAQLLRTGARLIQYKACSTADSAPEVGSIGRVIEIGREVIGAAVVPMLFAQPDFGRYTVFGQHFAAENGVVHRLDRQPTMSNHPSTPMHEADLARHFSAQTDLPIVGIARTDFDDLASRIDASPAAAVVLDGLDDEDLRAVGRAVTAIRGPRLVIGSGGLSWAIGSTDSRSGAGIPRAGTATGPILAVSGSRSAATRRQAQAAADAGWLVLPFDDDAIQLPRVLAALSAGRSVVLTADDAVLPDGVEPLVAIATSAARAVRAAAEAGVTRRIVVAGGDTSGRVTRLLGVDSVSIAANPTDNVVLLTAHSALPAIDGLELLLKGGQVGADTLLTSLLR